MKGIISDYFCLNFNFLITKKVIVKMFEFLDVKSLCTWKMGIGGGGGPQLGDKKRKKGKGGKNFGGKV